MSCCVMVGGVSGASGQSSSSSSQSSSSSWIGRVVAAAPLLPIEAVLPAPLDLLRGPGVVDFGVAVAALVEPVVLGAVRPVVVDHRLRGRAGRRRATGRPRRSPPAGRRRAADRPGAVRAVSKLTGRRIRSSTAAASLRATSSCAAPSKPSCVSISSRLSRCRSSAHRARSRPLRTASASGPGSVPASCASPASISPKLVLMRQRPEPGAAVLTGRPRKPGDLGLEAQHPEHRVSRAAGDGRIPRLLQPGQQDAGLVPPGALPRQADAAQALHDVRAAPAGRIRSGGRSARSSRPALRRRRHCRRRHSGGRRPPGVWRGQWRGR